MSYINIDVDKREKERFDEIIELKKRCEYLCDKVSRERDELENIYDALEEHGYILVSKRGKPTIKAVVSNELTRIEGN